MHMRLHIMRYSIASSIPRLQHSPCNMHRTSCVQWLGPAAPLYKSCRLGLQSTLAWSSIRDDQGMGG
jgi:hypothetical protein